MALVRRFHELHGEKELYGADQQAAQVQRQGKGAQRQRDLVHDHELLRADEAVGRDRERRDLQQEDHREQGQQEGDQAQQAQARQYLLHAGLLAAMMIAGQRRRPRGVQGYHRRPTGYLTGRCGRRCGRWGGLTRQPRQPGDVETAVRLRSVLMQRRLRDQRVTQLTHRDVVVVVVMMIVVVVTAVAVATGDRTDAVDRVLGGRQGRQVERVRVVQPLRQVVHAQLGVVEGMPVRRRRRRGRLAVRARRRR